MPFSFIIASINKFVRFFWFDKALSKNKVFTFILYFWTNYEPTNNTSFNTKENLEKRMMAEAGACDDKLRIAKRAKAMDWDAIHDTVHEMAKDEARHGKGFEGLYNRYFKK